MRWTTRLRGGVERTKARGTPARELAKPRACCGSSIIRAERAVRSIGNETFNDGRILPFRVVRFRGAGHETRRRTDVNDRLVVAAI
jgi:hypothetical protein